VEACVKKGVLNAIQMSRATKGRRSRRNFKKKRDLISENGNEHKRPRAEGRGVLILEKTFHVPEN